MATGEVDLSSLPAEEIFKLLESNNQEVTFPSIAQFAHYCHKLGLSRWCLRFKDSSMKI